MDTSPPSTSWSPGDHPSHLRLIGIARQEGHVLNNSLTRFELIDRLARAIAAHEGFFVTEAQAEARSLRFPSSCCRVTLALKKAETQDDQG